MTVLRATESFTCPVGSVGQGDLLDSSDPLVAAAPNLFEEIKAPQRQDVIAEAVDAPPEETDSHESIEAAEADGREDKAPVKTRRQRRT